MGQVKLACIMQFHQMFQRAIVTLLIESLYNLFMFFFCHLLVHRQSTPKQCFLVCAVLTDN